MRIFPLIENPLENVVSYSPPKTGIYLGSPSIAVLPDEKIIVSHDFFGPNSPRNSFGMPDTSQIFVSSDGGKTWERVARIKGAFWSSLFYYDDALYLLGVSAKYGSIVIRRSLDNGKTWSEPLDEDSGLLFKGGDGSIPPNYHCAPVPIVEYKGRLWRAFEDNVLGSWPDGFYALVISADIDKDLLKSSSWAMTNKLAYDFDRDPPEFGRLKDIDSTKPGWLEGNIVVGKNGALYNFMRVNSVPIANKVAILEIFPDNMKLDYYRGKEFIDFPGGMSKFTIRYDPVSKRYLTLSNLVINKKNPWQRNLLVLASSNDLFSWQVHKVLMYKEENIDFINRLSKIGFQYVDWLINGDDIFFVVRTAYNGAHNFHDSNYITFHKLANFREYLYDTIFKDWSSLFKV